MNNILITGGAGFIGSNLVRYLLENPQFSILNIDALRYSGNINSLSDVINRERHLFARIDICDKEKISEVLLDFKPSAVLHLAAETHVDRSVDDPEIFVRTNITGTFRLLEATRAYWNTLSPEKREQFRFIHVSTDEIYGTAANGSFFTEDSPYLPSSPYSASKASSNHLVRAFNRTYGIPAIITNSSNNYGPYQYPEKLIPLMIQKAITGEELPIYGDGANIRDWIYVTDHCRALEKILLKGIPGESYNIASKTEKTNLEVVDKICEILDELKPPSGIRSYKELISFVPDRPGHDNRYSSETSKTREQIGWEPVENFEDGLQKTVQWYLDNGSWVKEVTQNKYHMERLGELNTFKG